MLETLGMYKILDRIGAGGIGELYRARDTRVGRTAAIKVVRDQIASDPERRDGLVRDARAAMVLSHPSIAALHEIGDDQGCLFLAFEFVPGETLRTAIGGRPMNPRRALDFATQLADALADAHAVGAVHGDLTPDNVIVTPKGRAKILDFGLCAWTNGGAARRLAGQPSSEPAGAAAPTLAYLSPEQALGEQGDHRTDIFSLGVMLFEMLTGRPPFTDAGALALQIVQAPAPAPSSINPSVPRELDPIVQRALAKSLDLRYESSVTMAAELRSVAAILDERAAAAELRVPAPTAIRRDGGSTKWIALLLAIVAAVLVWLYLRS